MFVFNMQYSGLSINITWFQVYWISRHQIIASSRWKKIIRCCTVCSHDSFKVWLQVVWILYWNLNIRLNSFLPNHLWNLFQAFVAIFQYLGIIYPSGKCEFGMELTSPWLCLPHRSAQTVNSDWFSYLNNLSVECWFWSVA